MHTWKIRKNRELARFCVYMHTQSFSCTLSDERAHRTIGKERNDTIPMREMFSCIMLFLIRGLSSH